MMETLREVKRLRPKALWGVSPYPSCYNGDPAKTTLANYTGQCPAAEMALNDELLWLWKRCSALYPLLTLEKLQVGHAALLRLFTFSFGVEILYNHRGSTEILIIAQEERTVSQPTSASVIQLAEREIKAEKVVKTSV